MKFSVVICSCLLAWAESANMNVDIYQMNGPSATGLRIDQVSPNEFEVELLVPMHSHEMNLEMTLKLGDNSQTIKTSYCNDDMSTQEGALASLVRTSIGLQCPVQQGNNRVPSTFNFDGNIGELSSEGSNRLDVIATRAEYGLFKGGYFISAA